MTEPVDKYKLLYDLIERVGVLAVLCGVLLWFMGTEFRAFRQEVLWNQTRMNRNLRSIMQQMKMPLILDGDRKEDGK